MVPRWQIVSEKAVSIPSRSIRSPENRIEPPLTVSSLGLLEIAKEWETIECPALPLGSSHHTVRMVFLWGLKWMSGR